MSDEKSYLATKLKNDSLVITPNLFCFLALKLLREDQTLIVKITGRGRNTIYKILKEELNYIP
jgi:hypothetical protein